MEFAKPTVRNRDKVRTGRGYSLYELKEAGLDLHVARKRGVPVDPWRQTKYPENVSHLKSIVKTLVPGKISKKKKE